MPRRPIPFDNVFIVAMEVATDFPGSADLIGEDGRRHFAKSGVERRRGTVTLAPRRDVGLTKAQILANEARFEAFHQSLRGNDNQVSLPLYGGYYSETTSSTTAVVVWGSIADDDDSGGSLVTGTYTPTDANLTDVLKAGTSVRIAGIVTSLFENGTASNGTITFKTIDRITAQSQVRSVDLTFDWTPYGGVDGLGASEAFGDRLAAPVSGSGISSSLVAVDTDTGAPDLTSPIGSLVNSDGTTWFPQEPSVAAIAYLNDGRYFVVNNTRQPIFVVLNANGQLQQGQRGTEHAIETAANIATNSTTPVPGPIGGADFVGSLVMMVTRSGQFYSMPVANLLSTVKGAFTFGGGRSNLWYVQATQLGNIANTAEIRGMWRGPSNRIRVLRRATGGTAWTVEELPAVVPSSGSITTTVLYSVPTKPYRGAAEIGNVLFASAANRLSRNTVVTDRSVSFGSAVFNVEANLLAEGILFPKNSPNAIPKITYAWEERI